MPLLVAGTSTPAASPGSWIFDIVTGVLVLVLASVLIALIPAIRKWGARDKELDELLKMSSQIKRVVVLALGDETVYPKVPGWGAQLSMISDQLRFIGDHLNLTEDQRRTWIAISNGGRR